jgi:hypothetical protein
MARGGLCLAAGADALDDWSAAAYLRALKAEHDTPPLGARSMAIYSIAVADAVDASPAPLAALSLRAPTNAPAEAPASRLPVSAAAYRTALVLFPFPTGGFRIRLGGRARPT